MAPRNVVCLLSLLLVLGLTLLCGADQPAGDTGVRHATHPVLSEAHRTFLDSIIDSAEREKGSILTVEARTLEEARRLAAIDPQDDWATEYNGWFVFSSSVGGGPSFWSATLVKKGTNKVYYHQEVW